MDTWTKLGADLGETRQHLDELTVRLENMAAGIEAGKGTAGKLITDAALADEAQNLLARANETMSELQGVVTNLNLAVKNVRNGTARLPEITDAVADEAKDLPGLVLQTKSSMTELERLVEALQRQWLIRKYVNQTNPPPVASIVRTRPAPEKKPSKSVSLAERFCELRFSQSSVGLHPMARDDTCRPPGQLLCISVKKQTT